MGSVGILVRHDHYRTISQAFEIVVLPADLQSHDLHDVLDFLVFADLFVRGFAYIEKFSFEWEHPVVVSTHHLQTCHGECLGRISFCKDECALLRILRASFIGIFKLVNPSNLGLFTSASYFGKFVQLLGFCLTDDMVNDARLQNFFDGFFAETISRAKLGRFGSQGFFGLRVKCRVFDKAVDKYPKVRTNLVGFYGEVLVFLLDLFLNSLHNLVRQHGYVCASTEGADRVHEADLLKLRIGNGYYNFPVRRSGLFVSNLDRLVVFEIHVHVLTKVLDWELLSIEKHLHITAKHSRHIEHSLLQQRGDVLVKSLHFESLEVRIERDASKVSTLMFSDLRGTMLAHIVGPFHSELFATLAVCCFHYKLLGEDVG